MKNIILCIALLAASIVVNAQQDSPALEADQNPNYKLSQDKYTANIQAEYSVLQGTTLQETYKAIDPLEDKRQLKALKKKYRAQRPYWRQQRRLERIRNTRYYNYNNYSNRNYHPRYNNYYNRGLYTRHRRNIRNYSFGYNTIGLGLGLLIGSTF